MRRLIVVLAAAAMLSGAFSPAHAGVMVTVDKSAQRLTVAVDGRPRFEWPISTGRWGYNTPNGHYRVQRLERQWYSRKYDWSPMPHSIFFHGGYAIHGSNEISRLGRPASHGCIRLHPTNAATLFALVKANVRDTRIIITGDRPGAAPLVSSNRRTRTVIAGDRPRRAPARAARIDRSFEDVFTTRRYGVVVEDYRPRYRYRQY